MDAHDHGNGNGGDRQRLTELDGDAAAALAERALETEYVARLEDHLADEFDATVSTETGTARAFERGDGIRAVSFESEATTDERPTVAVTVHLDGADTESGAEATVVQAAAERRGPDVDGTVALHFPAELAPDPEAAVRDLLEAEGQSVAVTVDESGDVTTYTIQP